MSFLPAEVALICKNSALVVCAITFASVVLPVPGGPYSMMELSLSALIARYSSLSFPIICCCPTISSSVVGRSLDASGASVSFCCSLIYSNKSMSKPAFLCIKIPGHCLPAHVRTWRTLDRFEFSQYKTCIFLMIRSFNHAFSKKYDRLQLKNCIASITIHDTCPFYK